MSKTIPVSNDDRDAAMPEWVRQHPDEAVRDLYRANLAQRAAMHAAVDDPDAQDRIAAFASDWQIARQTITLAEAERRWHKKNLRQNAPDFPFRWQSDDGKVWLTTTVIMERCFGKEPGE